MLEFVAKDSAYGRLKFAYNAVDYVLAELANESWQVDRETVTANAKQAMSCLEQVLATSASMPEDLPLIARAISLIETSRLALLSTAEKRPSRLERAAEILADGGLHAQSVYDELAEAQPQHTKASSGLSFSPKGIEPLRSGFMTPSPLPLTEPSVEAAPNFPQAVNEPAMVRNRTLLLPTDAEREAQHPTDTLTSASSQPPPFAPHGIQPPLRTPFGIQPPPLVPQNFEAFSNTQHGIQPPQRAATPLPPSPVASPVGPPMAPLPNAPRGSSPPQYDRTDGFDAPRVLPKKTGIVPDFLCRANFDDAPVEPVRFLPFGMVNENGPQNELPRGSFPTEPPRVVGRQPVTAPPPPAVQTEPGYVPPNLVEREPPRAPPTYFELNPVDPTMKQKPLKKLPWEK